MQLYGFKFRALGGDNEIQLNADNEIEASDCARVAIDETVRIEKKYSAFLEDSVVSDIRNSAGQYHIEIDDETAGLIDYATACFEQSDGLFDITTGPLLRLWNFKKKIIPSRESIILTQKLCGFEKISRIGQNGLYLSSPGMEINFGGIGKEYAVDRAATLISQLGVTSALINFGGDIRAIGPHPDGAPWQIGIAHPRVSNSILCTIPLSSGGLATSGDYQRFFEINAERYCHIINPFTGYPVEDLQSATVIAETCLAAGTLSTISMLVGEMDACELLEDHSYLLVTQTGEKLFPKHCRNATEKNSHYSISEFQGF